MKSFIWTVSILLLTTAVAAFLQTSLATMGYGYGYGYGYGSCIIAGPTGTTATVHPAFKTVSLKWNAVDFKSCGSVTEKYEVEVWKDGFGRMRFNTSRTNRSLSFHSLFGPGHYQFRVRAVSADDQSSAWSSFASFVL